MCSSWVFRAAARDFEDDAEEEEERGVRAVGEAHAAVEKVGSEGG